MLELAPGPAVNAGVFENKCLHNFFGLRYPSVNNIVQAVKEVDTVMFKIKISRAFRHFLTS